MALASAGCEMPSSSYTAGPRPQLPGLWAAELASVASTQALQRDGWRDCEAGGSGRRGWARARNRLARSAGGCARARRARAWQAEQARHMVNPQCRDGPAMVLLFRDHFVRPIEGSAGSLAETLEETDETCMPCEDAITSNQVAQVRSVLRGSVIGWLDKNVGECFVTCPVTYEKTLDRHALRHFKRQLYARVPS